MLRLNVDGYATNEGFAINVYDRNEARVWGAGVAGTSLVTGRAADQYYSIGSNVMRITVDPYAWWRPEAAGIGLDSRDRAAEKKAESQSAADSLRRIHSIVRT